VGCSIGSPAPSDNAIRATFDTNKSVFEELNLMIQEDKRIVRVGDEVVGEVWFEPTETSLNRALESVGLSRERYDRYIKLLDKIGAYRISVFFRKQGSQIGMHRSGNLTQGSTVDVVYLTSSPQHLVDDTVRATQSNNTIGYAEISKSWYICRAHD
jgi:hypothetical protein